jgi:hypothetical protein
MVAYQASKRPTVSTKASAFCAGVYCRSACRNFGESARERGHVLGGDLRASTRVEKIARTPTLKAATREPPENTRRQRRSAKSRRTRPRHLSASDPNQDAAPLHRHRDARPVEPPGAGIQSSPPALELYEKGTRNSPVSPSSTGFMKLVNRNCPV